MSREQYMSKENEYHLEDCELANTRPNNVNEIMLLF